VIARLHKELLDPRTYGRIAYLLLALPLGVAEFTFLVTALSLGVGLAVTLIGIPILIGSVYAWRWLAGMERQLVGALSGAEIPRPYRPVPEGASTWKRLHSQLADPATWKDLAFLLLQLPLGIVSFTLAVTVLSVGLGALTLPLWFWAVSDGVDAGTFVVDTLPEALPIALLGGVVLWIGIPALGALGRLYVSYAEVLLGTNADPELTAQVSDLRDARSRIIAAADAERRRIERDLHDGAQQRLVALALTLRVAEQRAAAGDPEAGELVRQAGDEAGLALTELRDLARGIHPAILTNRGLRAALEDLAARATVPVEVAAAPEGRLADPVEATAYFVVSECLANVGKHAGATSATVDVTVGDGRLIVTVSDDGAGGADLAAGSGLQGLQDRVGALDGSLEVESPAGGGTRVAATIPLVVPEPAADYPHAVRSRFLPDDEAAARQSERVRRLRIRCAVFGVAGLVLIAVWAFTGASTFWPIWPLLGLGLVAGLDAWRVLAAPPPRESDLGPDDSPDSARAFLRRRRLVLDAGALGIVNLTLIGLWLAAGAGYFWPAWPLLGSAVAVVLKALPWLPAARRRLLDQAS